MVGYPLPLPAACKNIPDRMLQKLLGLDRKDNIYHALTTALEKLAKLLLPRQLKRNQRKGPCYTQKERQPTQQHWIHTNF